MKEKSVSEQIDDIIASHSGWKGSLLAELREAILAVDPGITEEIKWRMATRPEGLAVWVCDGIVCFAEIWKENIKVLFPKGAKLSDTEQLFNARLKSKDIRAIEFRAGDKVPASKVAALVREAIAVNRLT